jgi:hypothetical protein
VKAAEMRRAFAFSTLRNSWSLSRLKHIGAITEDIAELRLSKDEGDVIAGDEMGKRIANTIQFDGGSKIADFMANTGYIWHLGLSPGFLITNLLQPWAVSLPVMAARLGGMRRAATMLKNASFEVGRHMSAQIKKNGLGFEIDLSAFKGPGEAEMLSTMFNRGLIDVTLEHDIGASAEGKDQTLFGKLVKYSSWPAHHTEVLNRVATALATYRLSIQQGDSQARAMDNVEYTLANTHLDYTAENAPRLMRSSSLGGLGRVVWQFKKYTQGMLYLIGRNGFKALQGDKDAMRTFSYILGMQMAVAGAAGLPMAPMFLVLTKIAEQFWDDDEQPDLPELMYEGAKSVLGETLARSLVYGAPAGVLNTNLSNQIGMGSLLNPFAFANTEGKKGADYVANAMFALMGPAPALGARMADAMQVIADKGDYQRAIGIASPKVIANAVNAYGLTTRGMTTRGGDTLLTPDEIGALGAVRKLFGFQSTDQTDIYNRRSAFYTTKEHRDTARTRLIDERARASGGDTAALDTAISGFNQRHPEVKITPRNVFDHKRSMAKKQASISGGVPVTKRDAPLAEMYGAD